MNPKRPSKFDLARLELRENIPCPNCGRGLEVPSPSKYAKSHGIFCICGESFRVHIPGLGASREGYEFTLERTQRTK